MRRHFLCCLTALAILSGQHTSFASDDQSYNADLDTVSAWMNEWMSRDRAANGALHLFRFKDPMYVLLKPISWEPDDVNSNISPVTVPKGFVTDLTSVPRAFWSVFRPDGEYTFPAIVHDYLYWEQSRKRSEADDIFHLMMKEFDVDSAWVIYKAVDLGGRVAWKSNLNSKDNGERRVLRRFPQDPKMTWKKWKARKGVFLEDSGE